MYILHCRHKARSFDLHWNNGEFSGDVNACRLLEITAEIYEDEDIVIGPPTGPLWTEDYIADPLAAIWLVRELFEIVSAEGDVPEPPAIPDGADV